MGDIKIFILLLLSSSCYCKSVDRSKYRNLESYENENDHDLLDSQDDKVKAVWIDSLIKDDEGHELLQKEKVIDRDIFSHHKPTHHEFNPYSPPPKHYKQPPTTYVKPESIYQPIDESDYTKTIRTKEPERRTTTVPPVKKHFPKRPEPTTPKPYYTTNEFSYDNVGDDYYSPKSSFIPPKHSVSIDDIQSSYPEEKDTLLLVVKVPRIPNLTNQDKIQLPPLTLDLSREQWIDSLKRIFRNRKPPTTPPWSPTIPAWPPTIPPSPPRKIIKHKDDDPAPVDITINYIPKQEEVSKEKWYPAPPTKEHHHYTKPELNIDETPAHFVDPHDSYLNIEKPILLAGPHAQYLDIGEKPILLADPHAQYLDIGETPVLLVDYPVHHEKYWNRKKRDTGIDKIDSTKSTESDEKSDPNKQKLKSTYRGELPPFEFPKMKMYKGIRVVQSPIETDAPLYFPETENDDKVLSLVFGKHSENKKTPTPTKRTVTKTTTSIPSEAYDGDDSFAPLIFPDNVKLVIDDDDYRKYIPPTYFPETEADVDYKFEIRPFQQSVYDRLMRKTSPLLTTPAEAVNANDDDDDDSLKYKPPTYFPETEADVDYKFEIRPFQQSVYDRLMRKTSPPTPTEPVGLTTPAEPVGLTIPAEPVEISANAIPTVTTNDENLIDVPDKISYQDDDEDDNFKEVKPPLYFPETEEELRAYNELYNKGRTSGHRKLKVYQKKKPRIHKE